MYYISQSTISARRVTLNTGCPRWLKLFCFSERHIPILQGLSSTFVGHPVHLYCIFYGSRGLCAIHTGGRRKCKTTHNFYIYLFVARRCGHQQIELYLARAHGRRDGRAARVPGQCIYKTWFGHRQFAIRKAPRARHAARNRQQTKALTVVVVVTYCTSSWMVCAQRYTHFLII